MLKQNSRNGTITQAWYENEENTLTIRYGDMETVIARHESKINTTTSPSPTYHMVIHYGTSTKSHEMIAYSRKWLDVRQCISMRFMTMRLSETSVITKYLKTDKVTKKTHDL